MIADHVLDQPTDLPARDSAAGRLAEIARARLLIATLEPCGHDALDFHTLPVQAIAAALRAAYRAGRRSVADQIAAEPDR